ncbi:hypothetical protein [Achromobacter xylosoxidans]|uniref:hypothetical protein n=1 Tax=Alcaligenes xylosoxydans xylosoxydans TaxID=85698 RepID=UPI0038FC2D70
MAKTIEARRVGDVCVVTGPGFEFKQVLNVSRFKQKGPMPSIRAAKVICKALSQGIKDAS